MKNICKIACTALLVLTTSCIKSDYDTEFCPGLYTITPIVPVEVEKGSNNFLLYTNTSLLYPVEGWCKTEVGKEKLLELTKGSYQAVSLKDENEHIKSDGTVISVSSAVDGAANEPSDFVGGCIDFNVEGGLIDWGIINYDVPTHVQTRPLILKVKMEGNNSALIESITATVDGITLSRDLKHAFIENGPQDRYPALKRGYAAYLLDEMDADGYYTDSRRLLGLDANVKQNLLLTIHYQGGIQRVLDFDITTDLDGFHTEDILTPWVIRIVLSAGADFSATIEDWKAGPEEWIDAKPIN